MSNTPFTSQIFIDIWKKHFVPNKLIRKFQFIEGVSFYKSNFLPVFFNAGKNLTKGNNYKIHDYKDYKNKTFIIYDVLPHLKDDSVKLPKDIKILKSNQYPGFLIDLTKFSNIDEYLLKTFSKNTRMKMRKFSSRLDQSINFRFVERTNGETYNVLDANMRAKFNKLEISVSVNNIFNTEYTETNLVPMPKANMMLGVSYQIF